MNSKQAKKLRKQITDKEGKDVLMMDSTTVFGKLIVYTLRNDFKRELKELKRAFNKKKTRGN